MLDQLNREFEGFLHLIRDDHVLEIRMVKPKVNAICRRFSRYMEQAALYLQNDPQLRVGILSSGNEKAFSAGLDFREATSNEPDETLLRPREGGFGGITKLWSLTKPLIAAVNAPAIGGGLELALSCDLLVMADDAYLQLPELQRGLLPDAGGLQRLPKRIPYFVATAMIWTGEPMTAAEAHRWGLVHRLAPRDQLMELAWRIARQMGRNAPLAQQALKEALRFTDSLPDRQSMEIRADGSSELEHFTRMLQSEDLIEGQRAFLERREPRWVGR